MLCTLYVEWWSDKITLQTGQTLAPFHAPPSPKRKIFCLKDDKIYQGGRAAGRPARQQQLRLARSLSFTITDHSCLWVRICFDWVTLLYWLNSWFLVSVTPRAPNLPSVIYPLISLVCVSISPDFNSLKHLNWNSKSMSYKVEEPAKVEFKRIDPVSPTKKIHLLTPYEKQYYYKSLKKDKETSLAQIERKVRSCPDQIQFAHEVTTVMKPTHQNFNKYLIKQTDKAPLRIVCHNKRGIKHDRVASSPQKPGVSRNVLGGFYAT